MTITPKKAQKLSKSVERLPGIRKAFVDCHHCSIKVDGTLKTDPVPRINAWLEDDGMPYRLGRVLNMTANHYFYEAGIKFDLEAELLTV